MPQFPKQIFSALLLLIMCRCAQVGVLNGGKRDTTPPKLIKAIPENESTNFNTKEVVLQFDEFVQLRDLTNQLIVSPKIKTAPEVVADGRKIRIRLKPAELSPNTTYRFAFGSAVVDLHESNPLKDLEYTFSTGSHIDTLRVRGTITEAFNGKLASGVTIGLYNQPPANDSLPFNKEPDYISKSNDAGGFSFGNLPYSNYKVYAILDKNKNQLYDGESEKVAFLGEDLRLRSDTSIDLKIFQEEASKTYIKRSGAPYAGLTQVFLNKRSRLQVSALDKKNGSNIYETKPGREKDTLAVYYKDITDTLGLVIKNLSVNKTDTLLIPLPAENLTKKRARKYTLNVSGGKLAFNEKPRFSFLTWTDTAKTNLGGIKLRYKKDSMISEIPIKAHWLDVTSLELDNMLSGDGSFTLKTDTTAFFDVKGNRYDSSAFEFKVQDKAEFGTVILKLLLNKKQNYIVQLVNEQEGVVKERNISFSLSSSNAVTLDFTDVPPGNYLVKIVYDDNANKKWDTGNILRKQQPEKAIVHSKQVKVVPDWEIEEEIVIKE